jgi:hypothetical protein
MVKKDESFQEAMVLQADPGKVETKGMVQSLKSYALSEMRSHKCEIFAIAGGILLSCQQPEITNMMKRLLWCRNAAFVIDYDGMSIS